MKPKMSRSESIRTAISNRHQVHKTLRIIGAIAAAVGGFVLYLANLPLYFDGHLGIWGGLAIVAGIFSLLKPSFFIFVSSLIFAFCLNFGIHFWQLANQGIYTKDNIITIDGVLLDNSHFVDRKGYKNDETYFALSAYPLFTFTEQGKMDIAKGDTVRVDILKSDYAKKLKRTQPLSFMETHFNFFEITAYGVRTPPHFEGSSSGLQAPISIYGISALEEQNNDRPFDLALYGFLTILFLLISLFLFAHSFREDVLY
jgi:hypothetical protein